MIALLFATLWSSAALAASVPILGDRLHTAYTIYTPRPITESEAKSQGWQQAAPFQSDVGTLYALDAATARESTPLMLGFGRSGQLSSIVLTIWGDSPPAALVQRGWWQRMRGSG